jgi:hypothetical protein
MKKPANAGFFVAGVPIDYSRRFTPHAAGGFTASPVSFNKPPAY